MRRIKRDVDIYFWEVYMSRIWIDIQLYGQTIK
jgi:hypothetical protein